MHTMTASAARQEFARLLDIAQRVPVTIQHQQRDVAVVMSAAEYQRLTQRNVAEFQRFSDQVGRKAQAAGMSEEVAVFDTWLAASPDAPPLEGDARVAAP